MTDSEYIAANKFGLIAFPSNNRVQIDERFIRILARRSGLKSKRRRHVKKRGVREVFRLLNKYLEANR